MRTNLTARTAARSIAAPAQHGISDIGRALCLGGTALVALAAAMVFAQHASASEATAIFAKATGCHKAEDVKSKMFAQVDIVAYDFTGADAGRLHTAIAERSEVGVPNAILVRLVLVPATNEAIALQFGADGCNTAMFEMDFGGMASMFAEAGVHAPFGSTFYQMTGTAI